MSRAAPDSAPTLDIGSEAPAAPILVLVPTPESSPHASGLAADESDPRLLGLRITERTVLAARRAGYSQVFYLTAETAALPDITAIANWNALGAAPSTGRAATLIIAQAAILAEIGWLERLAGTQIEAAWAAAPDGVAVLPAAVMPDALALLDAEGGAHSLAAVHDRLTRRFGPPAALADAVDPMVVSTRADIRLAERRLLRSLVKDTDGFMARCVERPISLAISRILASTPVTPNQITMISVAIGLAGAPFFLSASALQQTAGALLLLAHSILDGCDGELARLKFQESRWGGILDFWGDNVVHCAAFGCMAIGWSRSSGEAFPLLLGAGAVLGTLGSAGFVYWRVMRPDEGAGPLYKSVSSVSTGRLTRLLDALSRRDFFYLILAFALFGKASWFLLMSALGAPIFFFLLVFLAMTERTARRSTTSGN